MSISTFELGTIYLNDHTSLFNNFDIKKVVIFKNVSSNLKFCRQIISHRTYKYAMYVYKNTNITNYL